MRKTKMLAVACACVMATGMCGGALVALADAVEDQEPAVTNYFRAPGFDEMLLSDEEEYALTDIQRCHTGSFEGAVAKREDDGNIYLELKNNGSAFCSFFSMMTVPQAGDYRVSVDFKKADTWDTTDNVGFRFFSPDDNGDSAGWARAINEAETGEWFTLTEVYNVKQSTYSTVNSFSLWFNTMGDEANVLMVDNVVIEYIVPDDDAPTVSGSGTEVWKEDEADDVTFEIDLKGFELLSVTNKDTEEEYDFGYEYDEDAGTITFDSDFCYDLGEGSHTITLETEVGTVDVVIIVYYSVPEIPETTDGYELKATMLGGDFEDYEIGLTFADAQTEEAWGSLASYDDPGVIVDDNGNHVLRLGRAEGSSKMYSSAFCMTSPDIQQGDIVTLKFSYKIIGDVESVGSNTNVSFVGASNTDYHLIDLVNKPATTREGNANVQSWPIKYEEGENGYTNVEMSFIVDFAFMNATNSLRFLYQIGEDTEIYIDNVELVRWVDEAAEEAEKPVATVTAPTFDNNDKNDLIVTVDLKDYLISSIKCDGVTVATSNFTLSSDDVTLTIKKEFLETLSNGTHTFTLTTLGGECEFTITVSNAQETPTAPEESNSGKKAGLSGGAIAGIVVGCVAGVALIGVGVFFLVKYLRKKKGQKK